MTHPYDEYQLKVSEIFYSPQGEGHRAGAPSVFVRLQGCSAKHACYASGVRCDTEFESGKPVVLRELVDRIKTVGPRCQWIIFTGGEPLDQLDPRILSYFRDVGFQIAIETSGIRPMTQEVADQIDWIVVSPKVAEHVLTKNFGHVRARGSEARHVHELRYVRHVGQDVPRPALRAQEYFLSPHSDGFTINNENVKHCIDLALANPPWRISVQFHKLWAVL